MHSQLFIDPRVRDYVFLPLCILMVAVQLMRILGMRYMNEPKNALLDPAKLAYRTLHSTLFECDADVSREMPDEQVDIGKKLETCEDQNNREAQALKRAQRCRKNHEWLPESAVKNRKAFFCKEKDGYLHKPVAAANMNMMGNPDMMNNMLKQNVQSVVHMMTFTVIGSIFQGFITAQVPFPLGFKFKQMLQQGLMVTALDPTYVSSMSWSFLLVYGLNGILAMIIQDSKTIEEMEMMASGAHMMQGGGQGAQKNYKNLFKGERDAYDLMNYKFGLEDVEDAFLLKFK